MVEKDERVSQRFQTGAGNHIIYVEGSGAIRDISMEGAFVLDSEALPIGATTNFSLRLGTQDIALQGIVQRSLAEVGMGIQFTGVSREARRHLRLHTASLG
jgi:hypothetical protein